MSISAIILVYPDISNPQHFGFPSTLNSGYEIYNMKGDKVATWIEWKTVGGDLFHIHVEQSPEVTPQRLDDIRDVIYSNETVTINNQTYYKGWMGAFDSINTKEEYPIPVHFHTITTTSNIGNVVIHLTNMESGDGYNGYTKNIAYQNDHQILRSDITIYGIDKLNDEEFKTILRHELGHAFGLAHSDNPNDLMHATVNAEYPYISPCDILAIETLYNGQEMYPVTCN